MLRFITEADNLLNSNGLTQVTVRRDSNTKLVYLVTVDCHKQLFPISDIEVFTKLSKAEREILLTYLEDIIDKYKTDILNYITITEKVNSFKNNYFNTTKNIYVSLVYYCSKESDLNKYEIVFKVDSDNRITYNIEKDMPQYMLRGNSDIDIKTNLNTLTKLFKNKDKVLKELKEYIHNLQELKKLSDKFTVKC